MEAFDKTLDDLEDMPEYQVGSWRSPYVKIYSIGGRNRIAEISNYPRAYKDTTPHIYTEDVPFIVAEGDLNYEEEHGRFYQDSRETLFRIGEKSTHWKGDPLPGAFPRWIESDELPFTPNSDEFVFPIDKVPGSIVDLSEGVLKAGSIFVKLPEQALVRMREHLPTGKITQKRIPPTGKITQKRIPPDKDKQIIRFRYRRVF